MSSNIKKTVTVTLDRNPAVVTFSHEIRTVSSLELIYFRLMNLDLTNVPVNLYLKVTGNTNMRTDIQIPSQNASLTGSYNRLNGETTPLYFKLERPYQDGVTTVQYPVLHGKQPKGMRWSVRDVGDISGFSVTLVGLDGQPYAYTAGTVAQFVFAVSYKPSQLQSKRYMTDRVYMNSMNA